MRDYCIMRRVVVTAALLMCASLLVNVKARAQEVGGDISGGAGIFRPKNPETTSKRRTSGSTTSRTRPATTRASRTTKATGLSAAEVGERVEDALEEGNEARDARKYTEAERSYRDVLQLKPRDWRAAYGLGNVYTDQQRWDEAEKAYRQAVEFNQNSADAYVALSYVLAQPRTGASNAKRLADAEWAARRAILIQADNAIAHDQLGTVLEARGLIDQSTEAAYRRAVELDPQFAVAHVHLARLLRKMNRRSDAEPHYQHAKELARDAPTLILIAEALQSEQRWDDSEPVLRRALEIDARNPNALFLLGRMLVVKKQFSEAEPILKNTIEISPRSFSPYYILGSAYLRMDRYEDAERIYNRAAEFASAGDRKLLAGAFGLSGVGDGYLKAGRPNDALRAYQRALQLDPTNAELQSKVADTRTRL